jgi:hypothetical protein
LQTEVTFCVTSPFCVEYFNHLCIVINYVRWKRNIKSRIAMAKVALSKQKTHFTTKLDFNLKRGATLVAWLFMLLVFEHFRK